MKISNSKTSTRMYSDTTPRHVTNASDMLKRITIKKKQVKPQQKDFMKKVCKDCALEECDLYLRSKRLGLSETWKELGLSDNINNLKTNCDRALRRAERVCKY